jgi:hypothetical protein
MNGNGPQADCFRGSARTEEVPGGGPKVPSRPYPAEDDFSAAGVAYEASFRVVAPYQRRERVVERHGEHHAHRDADEGVRERDELRIERVADEPELGCSRDFAVP